MVYVFAALASLVIGALAGYLTALSRGSSAVRQAAAEAAALREQNAALDATLAAERAAHPEKLAALQQAQAQMRHEFQALANSILEEKSQKFTEQNKVNLDQLLLPLHTRLQEFQKKVEDVYDKENSGRSALTQQVTSLLEMNQRLAAEARDLTLALKGSTKTQGDWGEVVLERILEAAGLRRGFEYTMQESITREDATRARPDVILNLPGSRKLVVDAKVSLVDYSAYCAATDEAQRKQAATRHVTSLRQHIRGLADRNYQRLPGLETLDFVILFVPIEPAFLLALESDGNLWVDAWERNILLVSPSTLLFVVRTVSHLWKQEEQVKNVQQIAERGAALYEKFVGFLEDLSAVGTQLERTRTLHEAAMGKLSTGRGNLIRQVEMLRRLGVQPNRAIPQPLLQRAEDAHPLEKLPEGHGNSGTP